MIRLATIICGLVLMMGPAAGWAGLLPQDILLVVNRNVPEGGALAHYYQTLRQVPATNLLELDVSQGESCSRKEYTEQVVVPLKALLNTAEFRHIRCLLLFYGMPLKILPSPQEGGAAVSHRQRLQTETGAAVDSELVLAVAGDYAVAGWQPNPFFAPQGQGQGGVRGALMVSRLDAANPDIVKRMMADSIIAEREGLRGRAYFDARWPVPQPEDNPYRSFDGTIHAAAALTRQFSHLPVILDSRESLLAKAPETALYCGWYQLASYQDVFTWQPGAVGYHVASGECTSLRDPANHGWCKGILDAGGAATLGPVAEPYLAAFPRPDLFFAYLLDGYYPLVESYFFSLPFVSWQMILLGDPLYRPFRYH